MKIRQKLTLQFSLMAGVIMLLFSLTVYFASATYRRDDFYQRLESRAYSTARLLIEVDEIDTDLLNKIEEDNPISLPDEKIIILNYKNEILYSTDTRNVIIYDEDLLTRIRTSGEVRTKSGRYELMGILFPEEYNRFVVLSAARDIYGFDKLKNLRMILLLINGIFLILYYPAGWLFAARAFSPSQGLSKGLRRSPLPALTSGLMKATERMNWHTWPIPSTECLTGSRQHLMYRRILSRMHRMN